MPKQEAAVEKARPAGLRALMRRGLQPGPVAEVPLPDVGSALAAKPGVPPRDPGLPALADLGGRPRLVVLRGPGGAGKTFAANLLASWLDAEGLLLGEALIAATDPGVVALPHFLPPGSVHQPATRDPADAVALTVDVLAELEGDEPPKVTIVDTGGGSTALDAVLERQPKTYERLEKRGIAVVELWHWTPRLLDLALLKAARKTGARPTATAMVMNGAYARDGWHVYRPLRGQPLFLEEMRAGAAEVWMPPLRQEVAMEVESKGLLFGYARHGKVPPWKAGVEPVEGDAATEVGLWMAEAAEGWGPARGWVRP